MTMYDTFITALIPISNYKRHIDIAAVATENTKVQLSDVFLSDIYKAKAAIFENKESIFAALITHPSLVADGDNIDLIRHLVKRHHGAFLEAVMSYQNFFGKNIVSSSDILKEFIESHE